MGAFIVTIDAPELEYGQDAVGQGEIIADFFKRIRHSGQSKLIPEQADHRNANIFAIDPEMPIIPNLPVIQTIEDFCDTG
ncbi:MAG: hypothetical protein ACE5FQ_07760 [Thiogranum sp.]